MRNGTATIQGSIPRVLTMYASGMRTIYTKIKKVSTYHTNTQKQIITLNAKQGINFGEEDTKAKSSKEIG